MSVINPNPSAPSSAVSGASSEFERSTTTGESLVPGLPERADAISSTPWRRPIVAAGGGFGDPNATSNAAGFAGLINGFVNAISNLFTQLASLFDGANNSSPEQKQTHFAHADAGSVGDPHESFDATTGSGAKVADRWDDMHSHQNLLSSDSFDGGYQISTAATQAQARGAALNDHASVTTDGGHTSVRMNQDGSYDVSSFGGQVALAPGQAVRLSGAETVTLDPDGSLRVDDRNGQNGSISTTLRSNGAGGVDVTATAKNVDLGGFLVDKSDRDADPIAWASPYLTSSASRDTGARERLNRPSADAGAARYGQASSVRLMDPTSPYQYAGPDAMKSEIEMP